MHIGLEHTADTISAGQPNSENCIGTSWLTPESHPVAEPAPVILHKPLDPSVTNTHNHIVWHGSHSILVPSMMDDTPEVADGQQYQTIKGSCCATLGCQFELPKMLEAIADRGFAGAKLQAAGRNHRQMIVLCSREALHRPLGGQLK